jgi:hypothetical protein
VKVIVGGGDVGDGAELVGDGAELVGAGAERPGALEVEVGRAIDRLDVELPAAVGDVVPAGEAAVTAGVALRL